VQDWLPGGQDSVVIPQAMVASVLAALDVTAEHWPCPRPTSTWPGCSGGQQTPLARRARLEPPHLMARLRPALDSPPRQRR
jgi:hypothetical protein